MVKSNLFEFWVGKVNFGNFKINMFENLYFLEFVFLKICNNVIGYGFL